MSDYMQEAVEAAAKAFDGHSWMTTGDESLCACGRVLNPSLGAGDAYLSHLAELAVAASEPYLRRKWAEELVRRVDASDLGAPLHIDPDGTFRMANGPEMRAELCTFIMDFGRASMRDQILEIVGKDLGDEQPST